MPGTPHPPDPSMQEVAVAECLPRQWWRWMPPLRPDSEQRGERTPARPKAKAKARFPRAQTEPRVRARDPRALKSASRRQRAYSS